MYNPTITLLSLTLAAVAAGAAGAQATPASPGARSSATPATAPAEAPTAASPISAPQVVFPASALGGLAERLITALNDPDSASVIRFAATHLGRDVRGRTEAGMRSMLVTLHRQSGGMRIDRIMPAGDALRMFGAARNGKAWFGMEVELVAGDSTRLASVLVVPMKDPALRRRPTPWATGVLTDAQVADVVRARVRAAADSNRFSGVVLVARGDSILVHEAHGFADRERQRRNTTSTPFATMSVGKMFTGVAIAQLVADGRLRFTDTVAAVLPGYPNAGAARRMTVDQLLTHTAGVPEPFLSARFDVGRPYASHLEMLGTFADAPLQASHGAFNYGNGNYATLAAIVEQLSGLPFEDYLRTKVWGPAGMQVTGAPRAVGYARFSEHDPLGLEERRPDTVRPRRACPAVLGFGCGAYTAEELYRFFRALRNDRLLPAGMADTVMAGRARLGPNTHYAYGFYDQRFNGRRVVGHSGSNPDTGHDADAEIVLDGDWTVIVLSNFDAPAGMEIVFPILGLVTAQN